MTGYFRNAEEKSSTTDEGSEVRLRTEEVKFNVRPQNQNRSYRRTCSLDSDDDSSDVSSWSPKENPEEVENNEAEIEEPETNNNDEHEIMSGVIEFGVSFLESFSLIIFSILKVRRRPR